MGKTIKGLILDIQNSAPEVVANKFNRKWMHSNDSTGRYLFILKVNSYSCEVLECMGGKITDRMSLNLTKIGSFEPVTNPNILEELDIIFVRSLLSGIYLHKRTKARYYSMGERSSANEVENIMDEIYNI